MSQHKSKDRSRHETGPRESERPESEERFEITEDETDDAGSGSETDRVGAATSAAEAPTPADMRALQAERNKLYEAWLRVTADFDNYRKRIERERQEFRDTALESLMRSLVPVLDNLERALGSLPPDSPKGFVEGVSLIRKQLLDVLAKAGLSEMDSAGQTFDPHLHEAVATETRSDVPHHRILEEAVKGYRLGKRVLRPAMVKVSVRPDAEVPDETPVADEDLP